MRKPLKEVKKEIDQEEKFKEKKNLGEKIIEEKEVILPEEFESTIIDSINWLFDVLAKRYGEKWKLSDKELEKLATCYSALINKYLPGIVSRFSIEINTIFWTTLILTKRLL